MYVHRTTDDDECVLNRHNCLRPYECRNTKGSFRCEKPRTTTTTTTSTTTSSTTSTTTTTPRPASTTYATRPVYTSTYRTSYPRWPASTTASAVYNSARPSTTQASQALSTSPCGVGLERNEHGACVGELVFHAAGVWWQGYV